MRISPLLLTCICHFGFAPARGEDWPAFRGPTGQGIASGSLPTEWGPTKNVTWKQSIAGRSWSSPIIAKGRVYLTTAVAADDGTKDISLRCLGLDAKTGKIHWAERLGGAYYASPLGADGKVYFQNEEGTGTVVNAKTAFEIVAKNTIAEQTLASYGAADGALFLRTQAHLYRIDATQVAATVPAAGPAPAAEPNTTAKETTLFDFEDDNALKDWSNLPPADPNDKPSDVKRELSREHATSGKSSLKLTFPAGRVPTVTTACPISDWTSFKAFKADVTASRACVVVFRALPEKSTRGSTYNEGVGRWEHAALLKPGVNQIVALAPTGKEYANVTTFDIFMTDPHEGDVLFIDQIRLSAEAPPAATPLHIDYIYSPGQEHPYWPKLERPIPVLGTDLEVANANDLAEKLKAKWTKPQDKTVDEIEAEVTAQFEEIKKRHPRAVLAMLRDGAKGYDPASPDKVFQGWKDCGTTAHPPTSLTVTLLQNVGKAQQMETTFRLRPALLQIDLASIPAGAEVLSARLLVVRARPMIDGAENKPTMFVAEPCNRPWHEFEMNSFEYAKDKFWKEAWGMSWNGPDPDFSPVFLAHGPSRGTANTWDFTHAVKYWTEGKHANHGFTLYSCNKYIDYLWIHTRKAEDIKKRPTLFVIYTPPS